MPGPIAHVQTVASTIKTTATSATMTETMTLTAGNLVVVRILTFTSGTTRTISSIVDDLGNTYVLAINTDNVDRKQSIYYCPNVLGGVAVVTATFSGVADTNQMALSEYSGVALTSPTGVSGEANGTSTTPAITLNPSEANSLYVGFMHAYANTAVATGDTQRTEKETFLACGGADIVGSSGSLAVDWTIASNFWRTVGVTFMPNPDLPTFVAAGAIVSDVTGAGAVTPTMPAHIADDILIVAALNDGGGAPTTGTAGWAEIAAIAGTDDVKWWWKRAAGAGTAGPDVTSADSDLFAVGYVFRGCIATGTPYEDATTAGDVSTADNNPDSATITTTDVNRLVVCILNVNDDTAWTTAPAPADWALQSDILSTDGTDVRFSVIARGLIAAGNANAVQVGTISATETWGSVTFALIPPAAVGGGATDPGYIGGGFY